MKENGVIQEYTGSLSRQIREEYHISEEYYHGEIKRGLRNSDGTGVLVGVTKVGSVQGYLTAGRPAPPHPRKALLPGHRADGHCGGAPEAEGTFGFEEVAYLLLMGYLPSRSELAALRQDHEPGAEAAGGVHRGDDHAPPQRQHHEPAGPQHPRAVLLRPDPDDTVLGRQYAAPIGEAHRLFSRSIAANAYAVQRHYFHGDSLHIHFPVPGLSTAENFLRMMRPDKSYTDEEAHLLDLMLMVHAEHGGGNNSTFVCRAMSSSGTDTYSAIAGAVGSLKGPLHGGANAKVMEMFRDIREHVGGSGRRRLDATIWIAFSTARRATAPARSTVWATRSIPCQTRVPCC